MDLLTVQAYLTCVLNFLLTVSCTSRTSFVLTTTDNGRIMGNQRTADLGLENPVTNTVDEFLRIPYAAPPTGERRFMEPQPAIKWSGILDATEIGPACPQPSNESNTKKQDEDCLVLNVYSPYKLTNPDELYPVMVFIHGGSYVAGTGNHYNGTALAQTGIVLVTINYRLGLLGFISSGDDLFPGNNGILDQIQALQWVQDNIHLFRGDKNKVTIFGSSAGGSSVGILFLSPLATGLFHRVISQSGTPNAVWATQRKTKQQLRSDVFDLTSYYGCTGGSHARIRKCLRALDWTLLERKFYCGVLACSPVDPMFKPLVDGRVLTDSPVDLLTQGHFPKMPYMIGTVRTEFGDYIDIQDIPRTSMDSFLHNLFEKTPTLVQFVMFQYSTWTNGESRWKDWQYKQNYRQSELLCDVGLVAPTAEMTRLMVTPGDMSVYLYYVDLPQSYHSIELNAVFGAPFLDGQRFDQWNGDIVNVNNEKFMELSGIMLKMWSNFAKHGNPTMADDPTRWIPTEANFLDYLLVDGQHDHISLSMQNAYYNERSLLWNKFIPDMVEYLTAHSIYTYSSYTFFMSESWLKVSIAVCVVLVTFLLGVACGGRFCLHIKTLKRDRSRQV